MTYTHRLATQQDTNEIASLMAAFNQERAAIDPTRTLKPDFDFKQLIDAGIQHGQELKVTDLDIQVAAEQKGMQALLQRAGFTKTFTQYTKHFSIPTGTELPSLHPPHSELEKLETPQPGAIPLRNPQTNEIIKNPQGKPIFLTPVQDSERGLLKTSADLTVYPTPVRHPQTQEFVFNTKGELVVCPVLRNENGQVIECKGVPQFHPPAYQFVEGELKLKQDQTGNYVFCEVERDQEGKIICTPEGKPVFKQG